MTEPGDLPTDLPADLTDLPTLSGDVHEGASAAELAAFYTDVAAEAVDAIAKLDVRPSLVGVSTLFGQGSLELAIPSGDKAAVDKIGDHYSLGTDATAPMLYQRVGTATIAGNAEHDIFIRVFTYVITEDAKAPGAEVPVPAKAKPPVPPRAATVQSA